MLVSSNFQTASTLDNNFISMPLLTNLHLAESLCKHAYQTIQTVVRYVSYLLPTKPWDVISLSFNWSLSFV